MTMKDIVLKAVYIFSSFLTLLSLIVVFYYSLLDTECLLSVGSFELKYRDHKDEQFRTWPHGLVTEIVPTISANCSALVEQNITAIRHVEFQLSHWESTKLDEDIIEMVSTCTFIKKDFDNLYYVSDEEREFPLAFSLIVHSRPLQVYRLLKAIYRPHNIYCIHPDSKADSNFIKMFMSISHCLDNVIVSTWLEDVVWGGVEILEAQLNCLRDLHRYPESRWKYVINLCGTELPLRTNREIVRALKRLNGSNGILSNPIPKAEYQQRFSYKFSEKGRWFRKKLPAPPHNIAIYKSMAYNALTRPFITYLFENKKANDVRAYMQDIESPEEQFYASLYNLPEAPGGATTISDPSKIPHIDMCIWTKNSNGNLCSSGSMVRGVCIVSAADFHAVYKLGYGRGTRFSMFFNKFYHERDHVIMDCMERRLVEQNIREYAEDHSEIEPEAK